MRVALVGWEIDEAVAGALAGLGAELVAFTRWFPDAPVRDEREGWTILRCPHRVGGDLVAEGWSFRDAVLRGAIEAGIGPGFDVVHAFDPLSRPAAAGLWERSPRAAAVGSITAADLAGEPEAGLCFPADRWIADHPWLAERWRDRTPGAVRVRPAIVARSVPGRPHVPGVSDAGPGGPILALWVPRDAVLDPVGLVAAVGLARGSAPGLSAVVLGNGPTAEALRRRLAGRGWLARSGDGTDGEMTLGRWQAWLAGASVVGVPAGSGTLADDPTARIAWALGVPAVSIDRAGPDGSGLADAIRDLLVNPGRRDREVGAGATLARRASDPVEVALGWLRVYLDALTTPRPAEGTPPAPEAPPRPPAVERSRLSLVATSPRAVYAAWSVRPDDWTAALEWLGADASRAAPTIRLLDITDHLFDGAHAHAEWDVDLAHGESSRTIHLGFPGRSLAGRLGVRSPRGVFLPLAHARLCHLPREGLAPTDPVRRVRALPRRSPARGI